MPLPLGQRFQGSGEIRNDSLFLTYQSRSHNCNCKGKKTNSSGVAPLPSFVQKRAYYHAAQQAIVIDETLQNQLLAFELMDLQGRVLLKQTNSGSTSIGMANLPDGVYLYRLLLKNRETYFGKIVKRML